MILSWWSVSDKCLQGLHKSIPSTLTFPIKNCLPIRSFKKIPFVIIFLLNSKYEKFNPYLEL